MVGPKENELACRADFYARRSRELGSESAENADRASKYTLFLIVLGLLACVVLYQSIFARRRSLLWAAVLLVPAGAWVLNQRRRFGQRSVQLYGVIDYYQQGIARLNQKWDELDDGKQFIEQDHFYSQDFDLFGQKSLYQLLCSAQTQVGRETLARWMKVPAAMEEIRQRQDAISELTLRRDLPESVASSAPTQVSDFRPEFLKAWVGESTSAFPSWAAIVAFLLPIALIISPLLYLAGFLSLHTLVFLFEILGFSELLLAASFRGQVKPVLTSLGTLSVELAAMRELIQIMEREHFSSVKLKTLAGHFGHGKSTASDHIGRFLRLISLVKHRDNEFFMYLSFCLLWGTQFAFAIERWRCRYGAHTLEWMAVLGELEALLSLSTYAFEHPQDPFPEVTTNDPLFDAVGLGHPLLDERTCVRNDVQLGNEVRFLIISGSNMSGKSTFLRAIGVNAVLAYMGAPVRCKKLTLSLLVLGAAIRIQDSVTDGRSRFLAEMRRLRRMIEAADHGPLLFLADEIMGGTNSHDRRIATEWVVRALMLRHAIGAISTHDLALTEIAMNGLPGQNVYFEDSGESGNLLFDYKLRPGILSRSNALNIAHMLGIDTAAQSQT